MKTRHFFPVVAGFMIAVALLFSSAAHSQEWSPAQKEVWKVETDLWTAMTKGDVNAFLEYFHPDYLGWDDNDVLPSTKPDVQKWITMFMQGRKVLGYDIKPVGIRVFGDVAILDYYYSMVSESDGKKKMEDGRWTDILMKQGGKWMLIGDNGGASAKKNGD